MADVKISGLPASTTPLAGTEVLPIVQSTTTRQVSVANLTAGRAVSAISYTPTGSTVPVNGMYLPAANSVGFATNTTSRMILDASGTLGLGVTPSAWSGTTAIQLSSTGSVSSNTTFPVMVAGNAYTPTSNWNGVYISTNPATAYGQSSTGTHNWYTAPSGTAGTGVPFTQAMQIANSGGVSIGNTTDPGATNLSVTGSVSSASIQSSGSSTSNITNTSTGAALGLNVSTSTNGFIQLFKFDGTTVGSVSTNTATVAYNTSSDYRLKNVNGPVANSGTFIDSLKPVQGTWKLNNSSFVGFIADEYKQVDPTAVTGEKDAVDENGDPIYQQMEYGSSAWCANVTAELQSLRARLKAAGIA